MNKKNVSLLVTFCMVLMACGASQGAIKEFNDGYEIPPGTKLVVKSVTPLSSTLNQRGDEFIMTLNAPLKFREREILEKGTEIRGLVKRVTKYEKEKSKASLFLLFDQVHIAEGRTFPISASLDTEKREDEAKIKGREVRRPIYLPPHGLAGIILAKKVSAARGEDLGVTIGASPNTGAILISNTKELKLSTGTEFRIQIDQPFFVPKREKE